MANSSSADCISIQITLATWAFDSLKEESTRSGVQIESLIRLWLTERLNTAR